MGIPGFFGFIKKYTKQVIKTTLDNENNDIHFFLDFNGAIYTAYNSKTINSEQALVSQTIQYLDTLISIYKDFNIKTLYIAIDGVPPRSKIEQQRKRRFHSVYERNIKSKLNEKHKDLICSNDKINKIHTNVITPGTGFMKKLKKGIEDYLKKNNTIEDIIFSSSEIPEEAEHKIYKYILNQKYSDTDNIVIYGLDADLIMLSIISHTNNIYLLREKTDFGSYSFDCDDYKFLYLDIDNLKVCLIKEFAEYDLTFIKDENINNILDDFVFICFLLGNDFIPKIPWLSIYNNGNEILLKTYAKIYYQYREFIVDRTKKNINYNILFLFFEKLSVLEEQEMQNYYEKRKRKRIYLHECNNELEKSLMILNKFPLEHLDIEKEINPHYSNWRDNYYKIAFNMSNIEDNKNKIIKNYLESILWTFKYYFLNITNWEWFYRFNYGPTVNDIVIYLKNNKEIKKRKEVTFNINKLTFNKSKPVKSEELLLMVLPMESKELFPKNVKLDKIKHYFPKNICFTTIYNTYFWQCKPILPIVDYRDIKNSIK
jgi:5'-3' exoribonuclease 1